GQLARRQVDRVGQGHLRHGRGRQDSGGRQDEVGEDRRDALARPAPAGPAMRPKLRVWVTFGEDLKFGDGRARLLELIDSRGSLKKAAAELEMSYRNAWGYLRDLERAAGFKFLERVPGGGPGSGMRLTRAGRRFL